MGAPLSVPILGKKIHSFNSNRLKLACGSVQGYREYQEDRVHVSIENDVLVVAVFDGHAGNLAVDYVSTHFPIALRDAQTEQDVVDTCLKVDADLLAYLTEDIARQADASETKTNMLANTHVTGYGGGTTAVAIRVNLQQSLPMQMTSCSVGDSSLVHMRAAADNAIDTVFVPHKPSNPGECKRIEQSGSSISCDDRIDDILNMSRAFGDIRFKQPLSPSSSAVIAIPSTNTRTIAQDDILILGSDGLFDCVDAEGVIEYVLTKLNTNVSVERMCVELLDHCICEGASDNISVVIIVIQEALNNEHNDPNTVFSHHTTKFYPGRYFENVSERWVTAYTAECTAHGLTVQEAKDRYAEFITSGQYTEPDVKVSDDSSSNESDGMGVYHTSSSDDDDDDDDDSSDVVIDRRLMLQAPMVVNNRRSAVNLAARRRRQ